MVKYCKMLVQISWWWTIICSKHVEDTFDVHVSLHPKYITFDIFPTRRNITQFIYFWKSALHVAGGIITGSGTCYTVLYKNKLIVKLLVILLLIYSYPLQCNKYQIL